MSDLRELYQSVILDHNKQPRNFRALDDADRKADGHNPICGDKLTLYLKLGDDDRVEDVTFQGSGCAISTASASLLTEFVKGKTRDEIECGFELFHGVVAGAPDGDIPESAIEDLGKLAVFSGVREFPMRVKCATLSWHTLRSALHDDGAVAKTE
jgi:nitrogen fixation NifU-like protein